jgi:uncharacterized RDD family membrane protein YckC
MFLVPATLTAGAIGAGLGAAAMMGCLGFLLLIGYALFIPWCWIKFGATPGKKIMGLRVVPESNPYGRLDLGTAVLRMVGYLVNAVISWVISIPIAIVFVAGSIASGGHSIGMGSMLLVRVLNFAAGIAPYLMILMAERKGIHDMISKTLCVKVQQ